MKISLILIILIWSLVNNCCVHASSLVHDALGEFTHEKSLTFVGEGFGIKTPASPIKWETFDDGVRDSDWSYEFAAPQRDSITIVPSVNRPNSKYSAEMNIYSNSNANFSWLNSVGSQSVLYIYYCIKKNFLWSSSGDDAWGKVKVNRVVSGSGSVPNCYYELSKGDGGLKRIIEHAPSGTSYHTLNLTSLFSSDIWHTIETTYVFSNQNIGKMVFSLDGTYVVTNPSLNFGVSSMYGFGIGLARVRSANMIATDRYWLDNIYIDNTQARVMIGNQPTFAASNRREIQIPTAWSDTSITITVNQGSFQNGEQAYLFVIDKDGNASAGFPITIGGEVNPDTEPPVVSAQNPAPGATNVAKNTHIKFHVTDAIKGVDQASLKLFIDNVETAITITGEPTDLAVSTTYEQSFQEGQVVNIRIQAQDLADTPNVMPEVSYSFTVVPLAPEDVNKDGVIDTRDVNIVKDQTLGVSPTTPEGDVNADSSVNVVDVQKVVNARQ